MNPPEPVPLDESLLRWRVWSFTNRREKRELKDYQVILKDHNGLNDCECEHFQMRLKPYYNAAIRASIPYEIIELERCKHIKLAEEYFGRIMLQAMFEREKKQSII